MYSLHIPFIESQCVEKPYTVPANNHSKHGVQLIDHFQYIRLCHTAAILSRETKKALFYHAGPRSQNPGGEAKRGKTKLFWSPGTIWPPCDKGELKVSLAMKCQGRKQRKLNDHACSFL